MPQLSAKLDRLAIVRSGEAWESVHERGQYYIQVGRAFSPARVTEIPSVGSVVAYEFESRKKQSDYLPPFVAMNFSAGGAGLAGPGMLPANCAPLPLTVKKELTFLSSSPRTSGSASPSAGISCSGSMARCATDTRPLVGL